MNDLKASDVICQLKITLKQSKPPIWRRVQVPGEFSLTKLHRVIQAAMGWTESHLHQFIIGDLYYSIPSPEDMWPVSDERRLNLNRIVSAEIRKFVYEYDLGDSWKHEIVLEKVLPPENEVKYPRCMAGKRACPPEDVGGIWGYEDFLESILDPRHEEHQSNLEWVGGRFDPEEFHLDEINRALRSAK